MKRMYGFGDLPEAYSQKDSSAVFIVPIPYDETSTWIKGSDKGPQAIIEASGHMELYDIETDSEVFHKGIYTDVPLICKGRPEEMVKEVEKRIAGHIDSGKFVVVIGGEHSVGIGSIRAFSNKYKNLSVLQLDAHSDLRDEYEGSKYNHACVMARVKQMCPAVQVGIRSMDICEKPLLNVKDVFFAEDIYNHRDWIEKVVQRLTDKVYITIDLDVFESSIMPSTGTPEPGGLLWYDVLALLRSVCEKKEVAGFDVVEMCPNPNDKAPDFAAAKLIYKLLSYKFR